MLSPNTGTKSTGGQKNIIGLEATWYGLIRENLGKLLKFADKMFMKQKMTKIENRNQVSDEKIWWSKMKRLELAAPKTKEVFIYSCLCHKQSG